MIAQANRANTIKRVAPGVAGAIAGVGVGVVRALKKRNAAKAIIKSDRTPKIIKDLGFKSNRVREAEQHVKGFKKNLVKNTTVGAVIGGASATATAHYGRKGIGRVVTNIKSPYTYDQQALKGTKIKDMWNAVKTDTPLYKSTMKPAAQAREVLYREMFDLKPRKSMAPDIDKHMTKGKDGTFQFKGMLKDRIRTEKAPNHLVMAGYTRQPSKSGKSINYFDLWDFKLNKGEKVNKPVNAARYIMDKVTIPKIQTGSVSLA